MKKEDKSIPLTYIYMT